MVTLQEYIENFEKAQKLADGILNQKISDSFDGLIEKINIHSSP